MFRSDAVHANPPPCPEFTKIDVVSILFLSFNEIGYIPFFE